MKKNLQKLIIDPETGMAGDMFTAALICLGADQALLLKGMEETAKQLGDIRITVVEETRTGLRGTRISIETDDTLAGLNASTAMEMLRSALKTGQIPKPYADFAQEALHILIHAEEDAHHHHPDLVHEHHHHETHLHEAQDILIDLVGAALGLQSLNVDLSQIKCLSPVYVGGGTVHFSHGTLSVPAPATLAVIEHNGIPIAAGPVEKELFTPTGASILAALKPVYTERKGLSGLLAGRKHITGAGFGTLDLSHITGKPNALMLYIME